ncbi:hypothetical protein IB276_05775 [Ensifer sp. ENS04]|uniref:hypothetical protein n=1 Tax=Ensifer sp. ENS04 TaxID=2769281 RepID=UPI00177F3A75|nr:hypothetical protein [Ensifer sp. ENS04]MBD9538949.1 hypothetical protein [Ensifer sp. ENS04]
MPNLPIVIYACILFAVASVPLSYILKFPQAFSGGVLAFISALFFGFLLLLVPSPYGEPSLFFTYSVLALSEEIARGLALYACVLRWENRPIERVVLGATFGWLELLLRLYNTFNGVEGLQNCQQLVSPLTCGEGYPYLVISWSEVILFHITISAVNYRDATNLKRLLLSIVTAAVIHTTYNVMKSLPVWREDNFLVYVALPTVCIALYAGAFFLARKYDAIGREGLRDPQRK